MLTENHSVMAFESESQDLLIQAAVEGKRIKTKFSMFDQPLENCPTGYCHSWRTIACNNDKDVVECRKCGIQSVTSCDFDDEYA